MINTTMETIKLLGLSLIYGAGVFLVLAIGGGLMKRFTQSWVRALIFGSLLIFLGILAYYAIQYWVIVGLF